MKYEERILAGSAVAVRLRHKLLTPFACQVAASAAGAII